jgi:hypothetical protein
MATCWLSVDVKQNSHLGIQPPQIDPPALPIAKTIKQGVGAEGGGAEKGGFTAEPTPMESGP